MERINQWRRLNSYSVNQALIGKLEDFIDKKVPHILYPGSRGVTNLSEYSYLVLIGSKESEIYWPIGKYDQTIFHDDIQKLCFGLKFKTPGRSTEARAIVLEIGLGKNSGDTEWTIALQDDRAEEKIRLIEEGLLLTLEPYKNRNSVTYPNEFIPTFLLVLGFLIGIGSLMFALPILQSLCVVLAGIAVYLVARRFTKGYCYFASTRQRQMDILLRGIGTALVLLVIGAVYIFFKK
jgi:hypothetical protein